MKGERERGVSGAVEMGGLVRSNIGGGGFGFGFGGEEMPKGRRDEEGKGVLGR